MIVDSLKTRIIRDSVVIAFIVSVCASVYGASLFSAYQNGRYSFIASLVLVVVVVCVSWTALLLAAEIRRLRRQPVRTETPAGWSVRIKDKVTVADVLEDARAEICFLGITAKRSLSDDRLKDFLKTHSGTAMRLRILLLHPRSDAFQQRAAEEGESAASWRQEIAATVHKIAHYRTTYGVDIQVRFYRLYPVLRLIIVDSRRVVANFFLEGKRGTESEQLVSEGTPNDLGRFCMKWFNVIWQYHSEPVDYDNPL